jgi:hypothetical protein
MATKRRRPKAKRPARISRLRQPLAAVTADDLAGVAGKCLENTRRIERLEFEYTTQVRRCAELQAEIDLLKRDRAAAAGPRRAKT